jgi:hypothetical protein
VVIIQENLDEFVDNAHVKALLDLRAWASSDIW